PRMMRNRSIELGRCATVSRNLDGPKVAIFAASIAGARTTSTACGRVDFAVGAGMDDLDLPAKTIIGLPVSLRSPLAAFFSPEVSVPVCRWQRLSRVLFD